MIFLCLLPAPIPFFLISEDYAQNHLHVNSGRRELYWLLMPIVHRGEISELNKLYRHRSFGMGSTKNWGLKNLSLMGSYLLTAKKVSACFPVQSSRQDQSACNQENQTLYLCPYSHGFAGAELDGKVR